MGDIFNKVLAASAKANSIPASETASFKQGVEAIANKFGLSVDDLAAFMLLESGTLKGAAINPKADNRRGCYGIFQACPDPKLGGGRKRLLDEVITTRSLLNMTATQQLKYLDKYLEMNKVKRGATLDELYLTILYPAGRAITDMNTNLIPRASTRNAQAASIRTSDGLITRNSLLKGLKKQLADKLAVDVNSLAFDASSPGGTNLTQNVLQGIQNLTGVISGIFTRKSCTPPPFTQQDFITYTGCGELVATTGGLGGLGIGSAAPGIAALFSGGQPNVDGISGQIIQTATKGQFAYPLATKYVRTSGFGRRWGRMHEGLDFGGPVGGKVVATAAGTITHASTMGAYGNLVQIDHSGGVSSRYGHLSQILVKIGQQVKQNEVIALSGNTGRSTGPHLHFEIIINGSAQDPAKYIPV